MVDGAGKEKDVEDNNDKTPDEVTENVRAAVLFVIVIWIITHTDLHALLLVLVVIKDVENIPEDQGDD